MHPIQYISTMHSKARFLYVFRSSDYMAIHVAPNNCIFRDMHLKARFLYVFRSSDYMAIHVAPNNCVFRDMH